MLKNDILTTQLSLAIQQKIAAFDKYFSKAMLRGIDEYEKDDLENQSKEIAQAIIVERTPTKETSSGLGVFVVLGLLVGAGFGINHMLNNK